MWNLRKATPEDDEFLYAVYVDSRWEELVQTGWSPQQMDGFLRMQFDMQRRSYAMQYPVAVHEIVCLDQVSVGQMMTDETDTSLLLIDVSLKAEHRNHGIGAQLIQLLQQRARQSHKTVRLHVLQNNKALHLYERLGFSVIGEKFPYLAMEWRLKETSQ